MDSAVHPVSIGGRHPRELRERGGGGVFGGFGGAGQGVGLHAESSAQCAGVSLWACAGAEVGVVGGVCAGAAAGAAAGGVVAEETRALLEALEGSMRLIAELLYGCGLRLLECFRLRIKDVDFARLQIIVRGARVTGPGDDVAGVGGGAVAGAS